MPLELITGQLDAVLEPIHAAYWLSRSGLTWLFYGLVLVCILGSGTANANCQFIDGYSVENKRLQPSAIITAMDTSPGTVSKATTQRPASFTASYASCTSPGTASRTVAGTLVSADPYTYATSDPNVGVRFFDDSSAHGRRYWGGGNAESATGKWTWADGLIGVEFVVLGNPLQTARIHTSAVATFSLDGLVVMNVSVSDLTFSTHTCQTSDVAVSLGSQLTSSFTGVGSTSPAKAFLVTLNNCPPGAMGMNYRVDPLTPSVSGSGESVVELDGNSSANGIGIQLLDDNDKPLALRTNIEMTDYDSGAVGNYQIPLKARYYQISTPVLPGQANTALTFSITYE